MLTGRDLKIGVSLCSAVPGSGCCYFIVLNGTRLRPHWVSTGRTRPTTNVPTNYKGTLLTGSPS